MNRITGMYIPVIICYITVTDFLCGSLTDILPRDFTANYLGVQIHDGGTVGAHPHSDVS